LKKNNIHNIPYYLQVINYSKIINKNFILKNFYKNNYNKILHIIDKNFDKNKDIQVVEIGCGPSFLKDVYPNTLCTDIEKHDNCDLVVDALNMKFKEESVDIFFLHNVFHHIPDVEKFLNDAKKALKKGGLIYIIDPHKSFFSKIIYKYFHHEKFDTSSTWKFKSEDPQLDSNQALAWIVFERDLDLFKIKFKNLEIIEKNYFSFLTYIVSGGLNYNLKIPLIFFKISVTFEKIFKPLMRKYLGLFCEILIKKS